MAQDSIAQIKDSFGKASCQAFDSLMLCEKKSRELFLEDGHVLSTSCSAPAYSYISGSHGSKFLCDFHYAFEAMGNVLATKDTNLFDFELIKNTFGQLPDKEMPQGIACWCGADAYLFYYNQKTGELMQGACNFHYRKMLYRFLENGIDFLNTYDILDYRKLMTTSILEEMKKLPIL